MKLLKLLSLTLLILAGFSKTAYSQNTLNDSQIRKGFEKCIEESYLKGVEISKRNKIIAVQDSLNNQLNDSLVLAYKVVKTQKEKIFRKNIKMVVLFGGNLIKAAAIWFIYYKP